jgi:hypothetical protein|tara:strand:+ start:1522 stop:2694 length:1173 start_codon:yes stop_codon:yes gene_type:complete
MAIWGKTSGSESRPKNLPMDSNSTYSREFVAATSKGWVMQPGVASAATGNDNASADPEILIAIRNLSVTFKSGNLLSIDWTDGAYADASDFDLVLTFDEEITVTSAAATANQTITNKVYILLDELGGTDMVSNSTVACQYHSGTGTNQITFRGRRSSTDAGFLGFTDNFIHVNGTATMQSDSETFSGILSETDGGQADDSIVLDASSAASGTVNGALTASTTVVVDGVGGTIAVGQIVTVKGAAASITAAFDSDTGISTDNTLTITAVEDQTEFTVSEPITVADNINLLFSADAGEGIEQNSISMALEGADGATSVVGDQAYRTGFGVDTQIGRVMMVEDDGSSFIVNEDGTGSKFGAEEFTTDASGLVTETQAGSASGSSEILKGVTTL